MRRRGTVAGLLLGCLAVVAGGSTALGAATPGQISFGGQKVNTASAAQTVTITNDTGGDASVTSPAVSTSDFEVVGNTCTDPLPDGASCTVDVRFTPKSAGAKSDALSYSIGGSPAADPVELDGTGTLPDVTIQGGASKAFSAIRGGHDQQTITLQNSGQAPLDITSATLSGDTVFSKPGASDNCSGQTVSAGGTCTVVVHFDPVVNGGYSGKLTFVDDAAGSPHEVTLTGSVLLPGISGGPNPLAFNNFTVGQRTGAKTVTITNTGGDVLQVGAVVIAGAHARSFQKGNDTCQNANVQPGNTCTVNVRFAPRKAEPRGADLVVGNDAGADLHVALTGTGVPPSDVGGFRTAAGCTDVALRWVRPNDPKLRGVRVIRNRARMPRGPGDGTVVKHGPNGGIDDDPRTFRTYNYAVFAAYSSWDGQRVVYSEGVRAKVRTQRVCKPRNGAEIRDLTPNVDWVPAPRARGYAFILQRSGNTILVRYPRRSEFTIPKQWRYGGSTRSLQRGGTYSFYVYAYTAKRPSGFLIGQTTWKNR